jgi:hypothetical protein
MASCLDACLGWPTGRPLRSSSSFRWETLLNLLNTAADLSIHCWTDAAPSPPPSMVSIHLNQRSMRMEPFPALSAPAASLQTPNWLDHVDRRRIGICTSGLYLHIELIVRRSTHFKQLTTPNNTRKCGLITARSRVKYIEALNQHVP